MLTQVPWQSSLVALVAQILQVRGTSLFLRKLSDSRSKDSCCHRVLDIPKLLSKKLALNKYVILLVVGDTTRETHQRRPQENQE